MDEELEMYMCPICGNVFPTKNEVTKHMDTHINFTNDETNDKNATSYQCAICNKKFFRLDHLKRHYETHLVPCPQCNETFSNQTQLENHLKSVHSHLKCTICGKTYATLGNLNRHMKTHKPKIDKETFKCDICGKEYSSKYYYDLHMEKHYNTATSSGLEDDHNEPQRKKQKKKMSDRIQVNFECTTCGAKFPSVELLRRHLAEYKHGTNAKAVQEKYSLSRKNAIGNSTTLLPGDVQEALGGVLKVVQFFPLGDQEDDMNLFLGEIKQSMIEYIKKETNRRTTGVKWHCICSVEFVKLTGGDVGNAAEPELVYSERYLHSYAKTTLPGDSEEMLEDAMKHALYEINHFMDKHEEGEGTGWHFHKVIECRLFMGTYRPLTGSQYIPLPYEVIKSKSVLNIKNSDEKCFLWCVLAHLNPEVGPNANRVSHYEHLENSLDMDGIKYPVCINDIVKFEKKNSHVSVNVFGIADIEHNLSSTGNDTKVTYYPLYISKSQSANRNHVNLLVIEKEEKSHYCLIRNLNRMLSQENKHHGQTHFCTNCLHGFSKKSLLDNHIELCKEHNPLTIQMPKGEDTKMKFKEYDKMLKVPYVVYADFECILKPMNNCSGNVSSQNKKNEHIPCGYSYLVVSSIPGDHNHWVQTYSGDNVLENFFEDLLTLSHTLMDCLKVNKNIVMTNADQMYHQQCNVCHICKKIITLDDTKVKDHCHFTGKYRGPAHNDCNLKYKVKNFIPVFFHNLEGYDSHLLMQELGRYKKYRVSCIAKNMEKYISFSLGNVRFLDSLNFMNESLCKLVTNLAASGDDNFHQVKKHFPEERHRSLLLRKGVYPYEWMDSIDKMSETSLPSKANFYSTLTMEHISDEDYTHAQNVWETFQIQNMKEYHDLYLKTDVLLLADCFENFREKCLEFYQLDPAHFFTTPGLSWCAALKMTDITLELISDIDMHLMVEKGVRGGVSTIVNRYCVANNKYMTENTSDSGMIYDSSKPSVYMLDLDANNLYGWAMSQPLPIGNFRWISTSEEIQPLQEKIMEVSTTSSLGYILEVDLEIPSELHDYFNDYVPAPEHLVVEESMLSDFSVKCLDKLQMKHTNGKKLIPNLYNKKRYVVHYRTLQCYLNLGLKLIKIHRAIVFEQGPWLKQYIEFNTQKRKMARNNFEKNFFKLMNNSVFGKTIENLRNRTNVELVHTPKRFLKLVAKPHVHSFQRFNNDLVAVKMKIRTLKMNRPNYAGMVILDLAKLLMYDFYYNILKKKYAHNVHLLFTDTDSLCVSVQTEDVYQDMVDIKQHLDFSDYPLQHFLHNTENKKVLGKFKDEMNGSLILEYVGLRAKMYSILWSKGCLKTCKGINRAVNKLILKHDMYKQSLLETNYRVDTVVRIGSVAHQLYTIQNNKISLSPFDDKRYILDDKIHTLAYGHYKLQK